MIGLKVVPVVRSSGNPVTLSPPLVSDTLHTSTSSWKSICSIYSRFQKIQEIPAHPNLCAYIKLVHARHDRLIVVSEHCPESGAARVNNFASENEGEEEGNNLGFLAFSILRALEHLEEYHVVSRNVSLDSIVYDKDTKSWKLTDYDLFHMTQHGTLVPFFIGNPLYFSPEIVLSGPSNESLSCGHKADVWALGVALLSILNNGQIPWGSAEVADDITQALETIADQSKMRSIIDEVLERSPRVADEGLKGVIRHCLTYLVDKRPTAAQLLRSPYFARFEGKDTLSSSLPVYEPRPVLRSLRPAPQGSTDLTLSDLFSIWVEMGGNVEEDFGAELGLSSSILTLPDFACGEYAGSSGAIVEEGCRFLALSMQALWDRLKPQGLSPQRVSTQGEERVLDAMPKSFFVLLGDEYRKLAYEDARGVYSGLEREKKRVALFRVLLSRYAATAGTASAQIVRDEVIRQAESGIPAALRGDIWCVIHGVESDAECRALYAQHLGRSASPDTERQISMDIVRCHQYHPLLASPDGQAALQRVLRAWLHANPNLTYWQGIDSVLAPFLTVNGLNEARAFCCLNRFVDANIRDFYRKENTWYLQDALVTLSQLITYYDPDLSAHLTSMNFVPNLYAVPWLLTAFSHIMTLDKVYKLWDKLLLHPLLLVFFAVEILETFKTRIMKMNFEECIQFFGSEIPLLIDVEKCLHRAQSKVRTTKLSMSLDMKGNTERMEDAPTMWWHLPLSLEARQSEPSPRMVFQDFVAAADEGAAVLDIRVQPDFLSRHYPGAINVPVPLTFETLGALEQYRGRQIVVLSGGQTDMNAAIEVSRVLVKHKFPFVCVLHGGMECLATEVPSLLI